MGCEFSISSCEDKLGVERVGLDELSEDTLSVLVWAVDPGVFDCAREVCSREAGVRGAYIESVNRDIKRKFINNYHMIESS